MPNAAPSVRLRGEAERAIQSGRADPCRDWSDAYRIVRAETERRAAKLSDEDQAVQSMPNASPAKWHRAHTTWFFEQFLLEPHVPAYEVFDPHFGFLFNSYYVGAGPRYDRPNRGLITRPDTAEIGRYRAHVDRAILDALAQAPPERRATITSILEVGLHHEQQHQELMLTDVLHAFAQNPLQPSYDPAAAVPVVTGGRSGFVELPEGIHTIGHWGSGFAFDNETPAHRALVGPVRIARSLITNAEWLAFMADGGYRTAELWLSDGWETACRQGWTAPGYWRSRDGHWVSLTLAGPRPVDPDAPVCHVSYYEADAFARWAGKHLPTEFEWEVAARSGELSAVDGVVWQWTRSAYSPYPGYRPAAGLLGEYNGKFMVNQMVLRGSSLATPAGHARVSYRNFFYPDARWQFSGVRLAAYD